MGLVDRDDYNFCASIMLFWVSAFAEMTGKGAGTPYGVRCWGASWTRGGGSLALPRATAL